MDIQLTINDDLDWTTGDIQWISGVDAISQDCGVRLGFFQGEWFLDQRLGVPWFQSILGEKPRLGVVSEILQKAIYSTPGIELISDFEIDYIGEERKVVISFIAQTVEGQLDYTSELII